MEVKISKGIIAVWLDGTDTKNHRRAFHCVECGRIVFGYYSEVEMLVPIESRDTTVNLSGGLSLKGRPLEIKCRRCKRLYRVE